MGIYVQSYATMVYLVMRPAAGVTGMVSVSFPTAPGTLAEFTIPTANAGASYMTAGPDDKVYFTETTANRIAQVWPSGYINEIAVPTAGCWPTRDHHRSGRQYLVRRGQCQ
jgi:streptogramin lyase